MRLRVMNTPEKANATSASKKMKMDDKFAVAVVDYTEPGAAEKFTNSLKSTGFAGSRDGTGTRELRTRLILFC